MDYYLQSLETMRYILESNTPNFCFEYWIRWLAKDIAEWTAHRNTRHHVNAYGGMGSFNDLPPIKGNDGYYEVVFNLLKSFSYEFAFLYGRDGILPEKLQEDCLREFLEKPQMISPSDYNAHLTNKEIVRQTADYLRAGTLLQNVDFIC